MELYIKSVSDITYTSELTLDILFVGFTVKMSRVKFTHSTYVRYRSISWGFI